MLNPNLYFFYDDCTGCYNTIEKHKNESIVTFNLTREGN